MVKWYMEIYEWGIMGRKVTYETYPGPTHVLLSLIFGAWLMLVVAFWPQYHVLSLLVVALFGIGVLFPVTMGSFLYGRSVENAIFMIATTYFVVRMQHACLLSSTPTRQPPTITPRTFKFWYTGDSGDLIS